MHDSLPPDLEQFVTEKVSAGQYESPDKVVEASLRQMRDLPVWTDDALRREIDIGLEQLQRGEGEPWNANEIKAEVRANMRTGSPAE